MLSARDQSLGWYIQPVYNVGQQLDWTRTYGRVNIRFADSGELSRADFIEGRGISQGILHEVVSQFEDLGEYADSVC